MSKKHENKQEQKPSKQKTTPAKPVELTDEELGQVVGGVNSAEGGHATSQQYDLDANAN